MDRSHQDRGDADMTEQPPSAEALGAAREWYGEPMRVHGTPDHPSYVVSLAHRFDRVAKQVCNQRVSAETVRWQNRDRQRLEQIARLQETVQGFQSVRDE